MSITHVLPNRARTNLLPYLGPPLMFCKKSILTNQILFKTFASVFFIELFLIPLAAAQDQEEVSLVVTVAYSQQLAQNVFFIDGVPAPSMTFQRGVTYVFDLSSPTLKQHPFALSESFNGTHSGGQPYTTSVVTGGQHGMEGAFTAFTPHSDTAQNIFFYCATHGLMGGSAYPTVTGKVGAIFASSYSTFDQSLSVPRVFVNTTPPQIYSLTLGLNSGNSELDIIEATPGRISPFAFPDTIQSAFDVSTNELSVKRVEVSGSIYDVRMTLSGSQLIIKEIIRLEEAGQISDVVTNGSNATSPNDSYSDGSYGY